MPSAETQFAHRTRSKPGLPTLAVCTYKSVRQDRSAGFLNTVSAAVKEKQLALGGYPDMSLTAARKAREAAKLNKSEGRDPIQLRKVEKLRANTLDADTFKVTALEWYGLKSPGWSTQHCIREKRNLEKDLFPFLGARQHCRY